MCKGSGMQPINLENSSFLKGFSESYLAELGRIIVGWSHVESQLDILYLSFVVMRGASTGSMSDPRVSELMGASFDRRIRNFRKRLGELDLDEDKLNDMYRTLDQLLTLRRERDKVAHAVWTPVFDKDLQLRDDRSHSLYKSWKNLKPHDVSIVRQDRLCEIFGRIHALFWKLVQVSLDRELRSKNQFRNT